MQIPCYHLRLPFQSLLTPLISIAASWGLSSHWQTLTLSLVSWRRQRSHRQLPKILGALRSWGAMQRGNWGVGRILLRVHIDISGSFQQPFCESTNRCIGSGGGSSGNRIHPDLPVILLVLLLKKPPWTRDFSILQEAAELAICSASDGSPSASAATAAAASVLSPVKFRGQ